MKVLFGYLKHVFWHLTKASYELNMAQPISLHKTHGKNETADRAQETFDHTLQSKLSPNLAWHCFIYIYLIVLNIKCTLVRRCYWKVWQKKECQFNILIRDLAQSTLSLLHLFILSQDKLQFCVSDDIT